nr:MAG TPA: Pre-mRNA-splicing factor 8, Pre-mRNA-splicing factor-mRNA splicing, spliceosome, E complex.2A [Caudoviricetes sp.]
MLTFSYISPFLYICEKSQKSAAIPLITALSSVLFNCLIRTCQR